MKTLSGLSPTPKIGLRNVHHFQRGKDKKKKKRRKDGHKLVGEEKKKKKMVQM